ncbi:MAG: hypothetical protein HC853_08970 [Anaerolineae bacterium]|nr:hypothetical protein [Anaerolineae bacterium]
MSLHTAADMYFEQQRLGISAPSGVGPDVRPDVDLSSLPQQRPPDTEPIPKPKLNPQFRMADNAKGPHPLHRGDLPEQLRKRNEPRSALSRLWRKLTGQD